MKLFSMLALLLLFGALFAATEPQTDSQTAAPTTTEAPSSPAEAPPSLATMPSPSTQTPSEPSISPATSTASAQVESSGTAVLPDSKGIAPNAASTSTLPQSGTISGYVGEGLHKKSVQISNPTGNNAIFANDSNESAQPARAPRMQPAEVTDVTYSCSLTPSDFSMQLGSVQEMEATCFADDNQTDCPELEWESALGSINATSNSTAIFTPAGMGNGTIAASSVEWNYSCSAFATVTIGNLTSIAISPQSASLQVGSSVQFSVLGYDDYNNSMVPNETQVNWSSQGSAGVVNPTGLFAALEEGNATIFALYNNMSANATVGVRTIPQPPQASGSSGGAGRTSQSGGTVGTAASVGAKRTCAGEPVFVSVSDWGSALSGATVSLYLKQGANAILVSQATSDSNGAATLKTEKEGNYELVASKDAMREGRVSFYLSSCEGAGSPLEAAPQGALSFAQGAGASLVLEKQAVSANFARTFKVYKSIDGDGAASYYADITTTFTNSAQAPLLNFEIAESVPSSVFSDVRSLAFTSYPRFSSTSPSTFYWKVSALSSGQAASFTYRVPRALSAEMISAFASPSLLLNEETPLSATVESAKGNDMFSAVAAFAGTKDVSQLLELAGMTILALAALFAAYTFFAGKKTQ